MKYPALICNCTKSECGFSECGQVSAEWNLSADAMDNVRICSMGNYSDRSFSCNLQCFSSFQQIQGHTSDCVWRPKCHISCEMWQWNNRVFYRDFHSNEASETNPKSLQISKICYKALVFTGIEGGTIRLIWYASPNLSYPKPINTLCFPATLIARLFEDWCWGLPTPTAKRPKTQRFAYNYHAKSRATCQRRHASMFVLVDMLELGLHDILM